MPVRIRLIEMKILCMGVFFKYGVKTELIVRCSLPSLNIL
ncbi:hypothetical protein A33Q_2829 [Indibacter alkaliphilus LW1]|uniref:Uncharacterized protein n=1 Tax=Indibacter alkaliphilus (strain CCUG 57479 / KCTC 22604 / LW1) TaxID=1189612 RepID=S2D8C9_INDAL|nr:hypothetical protein A33Q_2829 [Indibacter alkaliphilus LW1]